MSSTLNSGRVAGFWFLLLILIGPLSLIYIPVLGYPLTYEHDKLQIANL